MSFIDVIIYQAIYQSTKENKFAINGHKNICGICPLTNYIKRYKCTAFDAVNRPVLYAAVVGQAPQIVDNPLVRRYSLYLHLLTNIK